MRVNGENAWFSTLDPDHPIYHESGHAKHFQALGKAAYVALRKTVLSPEELGVARIVSRYAKVNPLEFVAETYAAIRLGMSYDDPVMSLYRKFGGPPPP